MQLCHAHKSFGYPTPKTLLSRKKMDTVSTIFAMTRQKIESTISQSQQPHDTKNSIQVAYYAIVWKSNKSFTFLWTERFNLTRILMGRCRDFLSSCYLSVCVVGVPAVFHLLCSRCKETQSRNNRLLGTSEFSFVSKTHFQSVQETDVWTGAETTLATTPASLQGNRPQICRSSQKFTDVHTVS